MPVLKKPDGSVVVTLGAGDVMQSIGLLGEPDNPAAAYLAFHPAAPGDGDGKPSANPPAFTLFLPSAAHVFGLINELRAALYAMGGVDPPMEACDAVVEFEHCEDAADWKDASGRLIGGCKEAMNRCDPRKRILSPPTEIE
jgi:hypothetical protein